MVRPVFCLIVASLSAVALDARGEGIVVADTAHSPYSKLRPIGIDEVRWTEGFWAERSRVCREQSIPAMWEVMRGTQYKPFLVHFLIAAGRAEGSYHGAAWNDGDFYKWIEAATASIAERPDEELERAIDHSIDAIAAAQRKDGYLHTPVLIAQKNGDLAARPFADRHDFEMYNMGHVMTAGCIHYRATGKRSLLEVAERAACFLERAFADPSPELARNSVCPSHYMGAVELYRTTGEDRYLRLAEKFFRMRNLVTDGGDDNQDRIPFTEQREAVGHAVRANYLYAGAADLYLETGDPTIKEALEAIWNNVVDTKLYVTGACGALFDGASPDGTEAQSEITRVHQAYGRNYQLPNTTAHNETCAAIGAIMWNWRMFSATGDSKYVDWMELALYNAVLSGASLEGTEYFYTNPLRRVEPEPTDLRWSRTREPFIVSYCCPPNVVRTIAELTAYAYSKTDDSVWVNLYGGNRLKTELSGKPVQITQTTNYPWDGAIRMTIDDSPAERFALHLRVPDWASGARIRVNGKSAEGVKPGGYATIDRAWRPGDVIDVEFPMPVVKLESNPLVEETRNELALKRGPIVYCLESTDLPKGIAVHSIALPLESTFEEEFEQGLLSGVTTLEGELVARNSEPWGSLYRPVGGEEPRRFRGRFVPYFAWGNRGKSEMTVWLPRD